MQIAHMVAQGTHGGSRYNGLDLPYLLTTALLNKPHITFNEHLLSFRYKSYRNNIQKQLGEVPTTSHRVISLTYLLFYIESFWMVRVSCGTLKAAKLFTSLIVH